MGSSLEIWEVESTILCQAKDLVWEVGLQLFVSKHQWTSTNAIVRWYEHFWSFEGGCNNRAYSVYSLRESRICSLTFSWRSKIHFRKDVQRKRKCGDFASKMEGILVEVFWWFTWTLIIVQPCSIAENVFCACQGAWDPVLFGAKGT